MERWLILVLLLAGCFPYRETYRPNIEGQVVDDHGAPVAGVRIESCSATHWNPECRYRDKSISDAHGRFHFAQKKEWDWCCLGEAPLPYTVVAACGTGKIAAARAAKDEPLRLVLKADPVDESWAKQACQ